MARTNQNIKQRIAISLLLCFGFTVDRAAALDLVGYVPYYRMNTTYNNGTLPAQLGMLNEVRYFGLTVAGDGTLTPLGGSGSLQSHKDRIATIKQKIDTLPVGQRPRLDITLGGAGEATNFATIAGNSGISTTLSQNIKSLLDETGATSVDIDWESPANTTQANNYATMLQRIKQEVGALRRVYATIEPQIRLPTSVLNGANGIDGISLMTYELAWWANDSADPNRGEHSLPQYVTDTVDDWTNAPGSTNRRPYVFSTWGLNADEQDLGIGLPFFGRVIGTPQAPQGGTAYTYSELASGGTPDASGNYYTYFGQNAWTAGPTLAAQRVKFAHDRDLQHIMIWELGQDLNPSNSNSLLRTAFLKNQTLGGDFDGDHDIDATDYSIWRTSLGSTSDSRADGNGNGIVDAADYVVWRKHALSAGSGTTVNAVVPEPATSWSIVVLGLVLAVCGRRARGRN